MHRTQSTKSIAFGILIASSFAILPIQLLNGLLSINLPTTSQLIEHVYGEEEQGSQEEVYLKFCHQLLSNTLVMAAMVT
jgi:hypothetical protein